MSLNFAIKDLLHHVRELKGYMIVSLIVNILTNLFLNILDAFRVLTIPETLNFLNYTVVELFSQFNRFLLILCGVLLIFIQITNNHALLMARKKDISPDDGNKLLNGPLVRAPSEPKPVVDGDLPVKLQIKSINNSGNSW